MNDPQGAATGSRAWEQVSDGRDISVPAAGEIGALRRRLELEAKQHQLAMKRLTVLSTRRDPYRVDTPANQRNGEWLAQRIEDLLPADQQIHIRGTHYVLLDSTRPDGTRYVNNDDCWAWLAEGAAKAARWLGYIPFTRFFDQRNGEPLLFRSRPHDPYPMLDIGGVQVDLPEQVDDPRVFMTGVSVPQPYRIVLYAEKSSMLPVLEPLAQRYQADMYVLAGEISDTLMHTMAAEGAADGRPMAVFTFSDADPSGWQMAISISRKLQALRDLLFPDLEFSVRRVGLLPDQVREYGLPSTPMKPTERRAEDWIAAFGTEQTEIDSLAALRPDLLREIAEQAISPFFDRSLDRRVRQAVQAWEATAQAQLVDLIGAEQLASLLAEAQDKLDGLHDEIAAINSALQIDARSLNLPDLGVLPGPEIDSDMHAEPLISSSWSFAAQCKALIDSKEYKR